MAITTLDQLVAGLNGGQRLSLYKASLAAKAAGTFQSLWTAAGLPAAGIAPATGSGAVPTNATQGAIAWNSPGGANKGYLARWALGGATVGSVILYDRLVHTSGLNGTLTTAQTINTTALTRYNASSTEKAQVEAWLEWYTATGSTASNVTVSYTNEAGTAARTSVSVAMPVTPSVGQMLPLPLQAGDKGVSSVETLTLSASTATAGNFGVTLLRRIAEIPLLIANVNQSFDALALGMPEIKPGACLALMVLASTTNTGIMAGGLVTAEG